MKTFQFTLLLFIALCSNFLSAQPDQRNPKDNIYIDSDVLDKVNLEFLPSNSTYITIQVSAYPGINYDVNFFSTFILLNPVFIETNDDWKFISLGIYNSVSAAKLQLPKIQGLFWDAFLVAYKNGKQIPLDEFTTGTASPRAVNIDGALQKMKSIIDNSYYRIRTGYYEQPGLEGKEKKMYKKLAKAGFTFEEEPFQNGRIYVTSQKYTSADEAYEMLYTIQEITGKEALIKSYYENIGINLEYLNRMYYSLSGDY